MVWFGLVWAELHAREGDAAAVVRQCERVLSWLERMRSAWWQGFRAQVQARRALAVLTGGDHARCRALLGRDAFEAAYERGRLLDRDDALALAARTVADPAAPG